MCSRIPVRIRYDGVVTPALRVCRWREAPYLSDILIIGSPFMFDRYLHRVSPLALIALLLVAACDSSDPVDEPSAEDLAGTYAFTQFSFNPNSSAVQDVNVLEDLVANNTRLRIRSSGQFTLDFQFDGGPERVILGSINVRGNEIEFTGDDGSEDDLDDLLLGRDFTLNWAPTTAVLSGSIEKTVDLEGYDPDTYEGLDAIPGTLQIRLPRQ